jgi:hypothetical protein
VDERFGMFGDIANLDARLVHDLRRTYHRLRNYFGRTRWISNVTLVMWNLVSNYLETVVMSVQDSCTVCAKHRSEIILDAPDATPRRRGSSGCSFWSVWRLC